MFVNVYRQNMRTFYAREEVDATEGMDYNEQPKSFANYGIDYMQMITPLVQKHHLKKSYLGDECVRGIKTYIEKICKIEQE